MVKYCALFCEENIWQMAAGLSAADNPQDCRVLLFFNDTGAIAVKNQRAFKPDGRGFWDYHVVLLDQHSYIHDCDTLLDNPSPAKVYISHTFPAQSTLAASWRTTVRVVPVLEYLNRFSSDRAHMRDPNGQPVTEFPQWPAIAAADPISLQQYINDQKIAGSSSRLLSVNEFLAELESKSHYS